MPAPVIFSQAVANFQITVWSSKIENGKSSNPQQSPFTRSETQVSPVLGGRKDGGKIFCGSALCIFWNARLRFCLETGKREILLQKCLQGGSGFAHTRVDR